jgi:signal transduction histidine kinase
METLDVFAAQLALVLDAADLLARTVSAERSLAHTEKLAAIGELAARIAHEIRNPAAAARSLAQQLVRDGVHEEEMAVILEELERVERRVQELLRFARRESPRAEPVDVSALVRATLKSFQPRFDACGVGVDVAAADGLVVEGDGEGIRQVLVNLIGNAVDAMAETRGPRTLGIEVRDGRGTVLIAVSDSGPGVPGETLERLFDPFFSNKPQGTGLGLAIVKRAVEVHGGRVVAESRPGAGMTFRVELPRRVHQGAAGAGGVGGAGTVGGPDR